MTSKLKKLQASPKSNEFLKSDFEFQRKIGDGAFGQVWRVRHRKTSKTYAIKQIPKPRLSGLFEQFKRELSIMYSTDHPHIVKLFNHFEDEKCFYMVMEFIEGGTLFNKLQRENTLIERVAAQYLREILLAIEYLHTRDPPIIHRDIKPENILISKSGKVKLTDFGWANYAVKNEERFTSCGTLEYLPPEIVEEKGHDTHADIWCLGVLLFEMLTGTTPFKASGKEKTLKNITAAKPKFPSNISHIPKDLINKMLEKDRMKRFDVFKVKSHRWFVVMKPIRETMVQNLATNVVSFVESEKTDVTTTHSDNDTDEDTKITQESPYRQSINVLKKNLSKIKSAVTSNRASLKENCVDYFNLCQIQKGLQEKVQVRIKEIGRLNKNISEILGHCFDSNLDLERLQGDESCSLTEKNELMQKRLVDLNHSIRVQHIYLESLNSQVNGSSEMLKEKEKELKSLKKQLKDLINASGVYKHNKKSSISSIEMNLDIIKSQIQEKNRIIAGFSGADKDTAQEISLMVREGPNKLKDLSRELSKKLEHAEEAVNEKEQQIYEIAIEYEMKKSQALHHLRRKKDEFLRNSRKIREDIRVKTVKLHEEIRLDLRLKLNQSRNCEFYAEGQEIDQSHIRLKKLKEMIERLEKLRHRKFDEHQKNLTEIRLNKDKLISLEIQIGILKSELIPIDYCDSDKTE